MEEIIHGAEPFLPHHGFSTPDVATHHAILDSPQFAHWAPPHAAWHHPFQSSLGEAAHYAMASLLHPHLKSSPRDEGANLIRSSHGNGWKTSDESLTFLGALGPLQNGIYSTDAASESAAMEACKGWLESKHRLQSSKMVKQELKPTDAKWVSVEDASTGLKLGKRTYFEANVEEGKANFSSTRKQKPCNAPVMSCQVDGCKADLSDSKNYHRRHKVCEVHSKAPIVLCNRKEHRFCQQCSRFHEMMEFDDTKRSCRKKLANHNERRRKPVNNIAAATNQDLQAPNSKMTVHHHQEGLMLPSSSRESSLLFGSSPGVAPDCGRALSLLSPRSLLSTISASKSIQERQQFIDTHISRTTIPASVTLPELVSASTPEEKIFRLSLTAMDGHLHGEQQHEEVPLMASGMLAQFLLNSEQVRTLDLMQLPASHLHDQQYNRGSQHG